MPLIGSQAPLIDAEHRLDESYRFVDLAVRLRVLAPDGQPGRLVPGVIGGRWDSWLHEWVRPTPPDVRTIEWTVQEQQLPLLTDTPDWVKFVAILAGRQAGKTDIATKVLTAGVIRNPGRDFAIVSLNYKTSREPERSFLSHLAPWWRPKANRTDRWWTFPHGGRVIFRSWEAIDSLRGPSIKKILLDEGSRMQEEAFTAAAGCGVAAGDFQLLIPTTPNRDCAWLTKKAQSWDEEHKGLGRNALARVHHMRSEDNPRADKAYLERLRDEMPADLFAQEFEGQLVPPEDAAYARLFNRALHIRQPGKLPEAARFGLKRDPFGHAIEPRDHTREWCRKHYGTEADLVAGWDFVHEACVLGKIYRDQRTVTDKRGRVMTVHRDRLWIVGAEVNAHTTTDLHAQHVAEKWGTSIGIITDAMGAYDRSTGRGDVDEAAPITILREHGFAFVEPVARKNPPVEFRHRTVCRALRSARRSEEWPDTDEYPGGEVRLFLEPKRAPELIDALENQRMRDGKPDKDGKHEHVMDALGYLCLAVLPIEESEPEGWESHYAREGGEE